MAFVIDPLPQRLLTKITPAPSGCWVWTAALDPQGYGRVKVFGERRVVFAHRLIFELLTGRSAGPALDHLCRIRACVNLLHLCPGTQADNLRRAGVHQHNGSVRLARRMCKRGHLFDEANTYRTTEQRRCRRCHAIRERERARRKAA